MSRTSQGMKSLSSTGRFISGCDQSVVGLSIVGMELTLAGGIQLFLEPRRLVVEILFFHPAQEGLSGNFTRVGIPSCELLLNERLDRFRHRYFHPFKLHDLRAKTIRNAKLVPLEYKKGKRGRFENNDTQLCAQAVCLDKMSVCRLRLMLPHAAGVRRFRREC